MTRSKWLRRPSDLVVHCGPEPISNLDQVHLWILDLDVADLSSPNPRAIERSEAFRRPLDRRRLLSSSVLVREVLGSALSVPPESLTFRRSECGKPSVVQADGARPVSFSLSHSENTLGLVLVSGREAGLDLEYVDPKLDPRAIESMLFEREELDLQSRNPGEPRAFYLAWTRKEAVAKMNGHGVGSKHMQAGKDLLPFSTDTFGLLIDGREVVGSVALSNSAEPLQTTTQFSLS